jgi:DNA-binding NtrC family response regulator
MENEILLICDDDPDVLIAARLALQPLGCAIETVGSPADLRARLAQGPVDALLLDLNFTRGAADGAEGLALLDEIRRDDPTLSAVLMTGFGTVGLAVEALKRGAVDFVLKPWQNDKLNATLSAALSLTRAKREARDLQRRNEGLAADTPEANGIIGRSPSMSRIFDVIRRAAPTDANILLLGESGTGKEVMAREIHRQSRRAHGPLVAVDLGAVPETLFESELFGHRKGSFTGAQSDRVGRVEAAHGGTLFLDEIGNLPMHLQGKLLTVLERREVTPIGANRPIPVDIRLVSATNRSAADLAREELFRQDLLFRIKTVQVVLPPLRERRDDIAPLLEHFLAFYARKHHVPRRRLSPELLALLEEHSWPGNVRELRHAVESATILASGEKLQADDFPITLAAQAGGGDPAGFDLDTVERQTIRRALLHFAGNVSLAAAALGLTRPALYRRMAKYGL